MKFSLIIGTINRAEEIKYCLKSILNQTYVDFEIIIIDQSDNTETEKYIRNLDENRIVYKHVRFKGLSRARNEALKYANGEYFCLIDDDAYYKRDYLEKANNYIEEKTILSGYIFDTVKGKKFACYKKKYDRKYLTLSMIMKSCPSAGLVFPLEIINKVGDFDEEFGVGSKYGSAEETDLLLRCVRKGYKVRYVSEMKLNHPVPVREVLCLDAELKKRDSYFEGLGALYKKHLILGDMKELKYCYIEHKLKFVIKRFLFIKYRCNDTKNQYNSFMRGMINYHNQGREK